MLFERHILSHKIFRGNRVAAIRAEFASGSELQYSGMIVLRKGKLIIKEKDIEQTNTVDALQKLCDDTASICLTLEGNRIINRQLELRDEMSNKDLLNQIFPNAPASDFYIQKDVLFDQTYLISIIRKDILDAIVAQFAEKKLFVVSTDLACGAALSILPALPARETHTFGLYSCKTENSKVVSLVKETAEHEVEYVFGKDTISSRFINVYAQSITFLSGIDDQQIDSIRENKESFIFKTFIKTLGIAAAAFFLVILLANYFLFDTYFKKHTVLEVELGKNKDLMVKLDTLKNELKNKQELLAGSGIIGKSRFSFYADCIAATIPKSMMLDEISENPLLKNMKENKELEYDAGIILVSGKVVSGADLNSWINRLNRESWVKSIDIINYFQDNNFTKGDFQIKITTH